MRTLIVDDEAPARSRLRRLLAAFADVEIVGEAGDGLQAIEAISRLGPELLLLDVQMPGLSGFEVLRALPERGAAPLVVFVTAYDEYALEAFEANAVGYLVKPVKRERLAAVLERVGRLLEHEPSASQARSRARRVAEREAVPLRRLVARRRNHYLLVPVDEVVVIRVEDGIVKIQTEEAILGTDYQLADLSARLPDPPFFRAHRSALVNLDRVREIAPYFNGTFLLILGDAERTKIQTSERQSKVLRERLRQW